jgi:hypothetical protein
VKKTLLNSLCARIVLQFRFFFSFHFIYLQHDSDFLLFFASKQLCQRISRKRRDFGVVVEFVDQEAPEKAVDLRKQIVTNYDLKRSELDVGLQAMPLTVEAGTQSSWRRQVNKNLQYEAISLSENSSQTILHSHTLSNFLLRALPLCSSALQQNETFNLFQNEFKIFENDDLTVGNKAENNVKDLHTLSDLQYSKQKEITCVDWIPGSTSYIFAFCRQCPFFPFHLRLVFCFSASLGMSCSSKATFDQRVDQCGKAVKSHILVWTLRDLITPQVWFCSRCLNLFLFGSNYLFAVGAGSAV